MIRKIFVLCFPKMHLFDMACPVQVFYEANEYTGKKFDIEYVGSDREIITEQLNHLSCIRCMDDVVVTPSDIICIPGLDFGSLKAGELDESIKNLQSFVSENWNLGTTLMSICTGSLVLAKMGLLHGRKCSTHWKCFEYMKNEFPGARLEERNLFSVHDNIYTSAGMTAGIDMCLAYLEKMYSPLLAAHVASEMVINIRREHIGDQQNVFLNFENKFHPVVYRIQQIIQSRIHEIVRVMDLSDELHMSERNLNRLFQEHMGMGISAYRNQLKIKEAEKLLQYSDKSIKEIAHYLGYATEPYFIRVWRKHHGLTPGQFRKNYQLALAG